MQKWKKIGSGDLEGEEVYKFSVHCLTLLGILILLIIRFGTYDYGNYFVIYYYMYHLYVWMSMIPNIFYLTAPEYWRDVMDKNRAPNGGTRCEFGLCIYLYAFMFGFQGMINYYAIRPNWRNKFLCFVITVVAPLYHLFLLIVVSFIFDPDHAKAAFIVLGVLYSYFYVWYTILTYVGMNSKAETIMFCLNPFHWISLLLGLVTFPIAQFARQKGKEWWEEVKIAERRRKGDLIFNPDLVNKIEKIKSSINRDKDHEEHIIRNFNQKLQDNIKPDILDIDKEYDTDCISCNNPIRATHFFTINDSGELVHFGCP
ncbi:unnamed protein product [Moneuplotes crassus]|uniref:Uncharacterized protein n=1 Tax=Euplotes crassus TaxID=5936 RepID=A0AAD2D053_EUPCR|nr:unnamed protein product [Moneuplotes crassus]